MADLSVTAGNVMAGSGATKLRGTAGELISAGAAVYRNASDGKFYNAEAGLTATEAAAVGICLVTTAADGQPTLIQTSGGIDLGATLTIGEVYAVSTSGSGGKIAPVSDLGSGDFPTVLGVASATDNLVMGIAVGGVAKP